jgi:UDP-N-acetylglucosamine 1-carboxyvinyltransferase
MQPAEVIMYEASDTGVENTLLAAALIPGTTTIKFASANYMVQDLCVFLQACGVKIEGIGTTTLVVHGVSDIQASVTGFPSEDPIESMFFISLAATTGSELTIKGCPMDFLELELYTLEHMGLQYSRGEKYVSANGHTALADITIKPSTLIAPPEKIAPRPYPGINIDNLPYFVPVATQARGTTLIHDWVYEGRAKHYMEMTKLGATMRQIDPHRVEIDGPTPLHACDITAPPALRPATLLLIGMLAAEGESMLSNVYPISRGYENLHERLAALGASVEAIE